MKKRVPVAASRRKQKQKSTKPGGKHESVDAKYLPAFERWKAGSSAVLTLCKELGIHSGHTLTKIFKRLAGGVPQYQALRKAGAGGGHVPFGGKRAGPRTVEQVSLDDSKVKRVTSSKNWKQRFEYEGANVRYKDSKGATGVFPWRQQKLHVFISPKGDEYVIAKGTEKADLLVTPRGTKHTVRLRKLEHSAALRQIKHEREEVVRGQKARTAKKKDKDKKKKHLKKLATK
jgi:cupin superfamily acireductone dioxygenase involved in methionine salvage